VLIVLIEANIFFFRQVLVFHRRKRINSVGRGPLDLNRFGMEKNRTELKLIDLNQFSIQFGSKN